MRRVTTEPVLVSWLATRIPLALLLMGALRYPWLTKIIGDVSLYEGWSRYLGHGRFPQQDPFWQYPPGAAGLMLGVQALPGGYLGAFVFVAALADLAVCLLLLRMAGRPGGSRAGAWLWVAAVPLLGPLVYGRFDVVVAAVAVAALAAAARPALSGSLIGVGAMLKVWPLLLLFGTRPRRRSAVHALAATAVTCLTLLAVIAWLLPGGLSFLRYQRDRGLQIESVPASLFLVGQHFGWSGTVASQYGSREFVGAWVGLVATVAPLLTLAAFGALLLWRRRSRWGPATGPDAALAATLLATVTSRVLSPQYFVWLLALAAVCLSVRATTQRTVGWGLLGCAVLTHLEFPILWRDLGTGDPRADLVLLCRNVLLIGVTWISVRALWESTRVDVPVDGARPAEQDRVAARVGA